MIWQKYNCDSVDDTNKKEANGLVWLTIKSKKDIGIRKV